MRVDEGLEILLGLREPHEMAKWCITAAVTTVMYAGLVFVVLVLTGWLVVFRRWGWF